MNSTMLRFPSSSTDHRIRSMFPRYLSLVLCLIVGASVASAQAPPNATSEARNESSSGGKITGRVIGDDGRPVQDAVVFIYRSYATASGPPRSVATDSDGQFEIPNLAAGLYTLSANLPAFVSALDLAAEGAEPRFYKPGDSVSLTLIKGGVITGTVRDAVGQPVVAVPVRAVRIRDAGGRAITRTLSFSQFRMTDDRGIYRLFGLQAGTYLVTAGGNLGFSGIINAYDGDAATYFPSSTRDTAVEVPVRSGEEATSIDIRYRGDRGRVISGTVTGGRESERGTGVTITMVQTSSGAVEAATFVSSGMKGAYSFAGIADGEYELMAQQGGVSGESGATATRKVTVKGADVTGVDLPLVTMGSIAGRVYLEAAPKETCKEPQAGTFLETLVAVRRDEKSQAKPTGRQPFYEGNGSIPSDQGKFTIFNLYAGNYRLTLRPPNETWYVRSVALPVMAPANTGPATKPSDATSKFVRPVVSLKSGEKVSDVTINLAQDGAIVRGRVVPAKAGASLPSNLKVYLVPVERERSDDTFRYGEVTFESDGAFALTNIAPGKYFVIARIAPEVDPNQRFPPPIAWNASTRVKLRAAAEAGGTTIELRPCQRLNDFVLQYPLAPSVTKP